MSRKETDVSMRSNVILWMLLCASTVWFQVTGYSDIANTAPANPGFASIAQYCFFASAFLCAVFVAIFARPATRHMTLLSFLAALCTIIGSIVFVFASYQTLVEATLLVSAASCALGLGFNWSLLLSLKLMKEYSDITGLVTLLVTSVVISALVSSLILAIPSEVMRIAFILVVASATAFLQIISSAAIRRGNQESSGMTLKETFRAIKASDSIKQQLLLLTSVSVAVFIMRAISSAGLWGSAVELPIGWIKVGQTALGAVVFAAATLLVYRIAARSRFSLRSQLPLLVLIAGFFLILLTMPVSFGSPAYAVLERSVEWYCNVVSYLTIAAAVRSLPFLSNRVISVATSLPLAFSLLWMTFGKSGSLGIDTVVLFTVYILILATLWLKPFRVLDQKQEGEQEFGDHYQNLTETCKAVARDFALTKRETEVLILLAQGRSTPYVEKELVVSNATARTHVRHVYEKLEVHSKQDLLDLIQSYPLAGAQ